MKSKKSSRLTIYNYIGRMAVVLVLTVLTFIISAMLVAIWMESGGWKYEGHEIFFWIWSGTPTIGMFIGLICEMIINGGKLK